MLLYYHKFKDRLIIIKLCATELKIPFTFFFIPTSSQRLLQIASAETLFFKLFEGNK